MGATLSMPTAKPIATAFAFLATLIAVWQIACHIRYYSAPLYQRYIVRLVFMVPVYSMASWLSLLAPESEVYYDAIRDCFEAWVIYNFLSLLLAYVGGPGAVEVKLSGTQLAPSVAACTCCLPPLPVNGMFVKASKRMALQFVLVKPALAALTVALYASGHMTEGDWSITSWYLWIALVYNATYTTALYGLAMFYRGTHTLLAPFKPLLKFLIVKLVVFLTFWQGLLIAILVALGAVPSMQAATALQNFLICAEMLPAAVFMLFAFPWSIYKVAGHATGLKAGNVSHALSVNDVVTDTVHHFAPAYHDYVLYNGSEAEADAQGGARGGDAGGAGGGLAVELARKGLLARGAEARPDKRRLLRMDRGAYWRTMEEAVIVADLAQLGHPGAALAYPPVQLTPLCAEQLAPALGASKAALLGGGPPEAPAELPAAPAVHSVVVVVEEGTGGGSRNAGGAWGEATVEESRSSREPSGIAASAQWQSVG